MSYNSAFYDKAQSLFPIVDFDVKLFDRTELKQIWFALWKFVKHQFQTYQIVFKLFNKSESKKKEGDNYLIIKKNTHTHKATKIRT